MAEESEKLPDVLRGSYEGSFAFKTISERMPVILTKVIDLFHREKVNIAETYGSGAAEGVKLAVGQLSALKSTMQRNKALEPLTEAAAVDAALWQRLLSDAAGRHGGELRWFAAPWLLVECYMYRKICDIIDSNGLTGYDHFAEQKHASLEASLEAMHVLGEHLLATLGQPDARETHNLERSFTDFLGMSLWANKNDLSISAGAHVSQRDSPLLQLSQLESRVLVNDTAQVLQLVHKLRARTAGRLDIVMDNAGPELFADLCLADLLLALGVVAQVRLHVKRLPWFVSDTTPSDVSATLQRMMEAGEQHPALATLAHRWQRHLDDGVWKLETDPFWTSPLPFSRMPDEAPALYQHLQAADLIIFKGDLNYRKLLGDRAWPHATPFCRALEGFQPAPLVALRTLKADLVAGLAADQETRAAAEADWMTSGQWALVQLCERPRAAGTVAADTLPASDGRAQRADRDRREL